MVIKIVDRSTILKGDNMISNKEREAIHSKLVKGYIHSIKTRLSLWLYDGVKMEHRNWPDLHIYPSKINFNGEIINLTPEQKKELNEAVQQRLDKL
jgi:hypothetical protein